MTFLSVYSARPLVVLTRHGQRNTKFLVMEKEKNYLVEMGRGVFANQHGMRVWHSVGCFSKKPRQRRDWKIHL